MSWTARCIAVSLLAVTPWTMAEGQRARTDSSGAPDRHVSEAAGGLALGPGTRVRVYYQSPDSAPGPRWPPLERNSHHIVTGTLRSLRRDEIVVDDDGLLGSSRMLSIPRGALQRVEVSRGRDRRRTVVAGVVGAAMGAVALRNFSNPRVMIGGMALGGLVGATQLGERWETRSLPSRWPDAPVQP